ncbi:CDP-glycerol glycerophosphotransferase family protein [Shouchella sp. 1P09AA]|uniref:CDP-glycerol glycerophosphotransferase family protein n=1 Tax=unclassified Shouchella TaxID=2893065 RepID=UPI0039A0D14E
MSVLQDLNEEDVLVRNIIRRNVTDLSFNGGLLHIAGYAYVEGFSLESEDVIYKALIFKTNDKESKVKFEIPLLDEVADVDPFYLWAGFRGKVNLSTITKGGAPLPNGSYNAYIQLIYDDPYMGKMTEEVPLGNVRSFLKNDFHSAKLEMFSAKRILEYNLMAKPNQRLKTLQIDSTKLKDLKPSDLEHNQVKQTKKSKQRSQRLFQFFYKLFHLAKVKSDRITFASDSRTEMNGNFGFVYDEMCKQNLKYDYKFMLKNSISDRKSLKEQIQLAYWFATSSKIILDDFYPIIYPLKIRQGSDLIQVWHAVGAFKTFGYSRVGKPGGPSIKSLNHRNYTQAVVSSNNIVPQYAEGFGIQESAVAPVGVPRTDVFFDEAYKENKRHELYNKYPYLRDKKVILFAPTFRGNGQASAHYPYDMLELDKLYEQLKDDYVFLLKVHPFVKNKLSIPYQYTDFFYDFSDYREVNDLLFITDILITDYSSVCFEFALLKKPMIFFSFDVEEYIQKRDFYFEYQSFIPGVLTKTTDEMINRIVTEEFESDRIEPFIHYFFDELDGKASERFVNQLIKEEMSEK